MDPKHYGHWIAFEELGRGGQGIVYKAVREGTNSAFYKDVRAGLQGAVATSLHGNDQEAIDKLYHAFAARLKGDFAEFGALKVLHQPVKQDEAYEKAKKRMCAEIKAHASIVHANLTRILDHSADDISWIVFEYCDKGTLADHQTRFKGDCLGSVKAFRGLVQATARMHEAGCVHRDIKPSNIFLGRDNRLILGDLGLVYFEDDERTRVTETYEKIGTTNYMAPWLIGGGRIEHIRPSCDVFALGKILWSLVSGKRLLPLWYIDKKEYDLRKQFPNTTDVEVIHDRILRTIVVQEEDDCLSDAGKLVDVADEVIAILEAEISRGCKMCASGKYVGDVGEHRGGQYRLWCKRCGHLLQFKSDENCKLPEWVTLLKNEDERLT